MSKGSARQRKKEEKNKTIEDAFKKLEKESKTYNGPKRDFWLYVRKNVFTDDTNLTKRKLEAQCRLDEEIYFEEVNYFTNGFSFLKHFPEITGQRCIRKFKDKEAARRYLDLRTELQKGSKEELTITKMLEGDIDNATRRILQARLNVIDMEKGKRQLEKSSR